jgi:hypothetical protein
MDAWVHAAAHNTGLTAWLLNKGQQLAEASTLCCFVWLQVDHLHHEVHPDNTIGVGTTLTW